jgi:uncharacterized protein (DUF885 family)
MKKICLFLLLFLSLPVFALQKSTKDFEKSLKQWEQSSESLPKKIDKLYAIYWDYLMHSYPEWASYVGYADLNSDLTDLSLAAIEQRKKFAKKLFTVVKNIPENKLKGEALISFQLFKNDLHENIEGQIFPEDLLPVNQMYGVQIDFTNLLISAPKTRLKDYEDRIERLKKFPLQIAQTERLMREGLNKKVTQTKVVMNSVPLQLEALLVRDLEKNPLYKSFLEIAVTASDQEKKKIQMDAQKEILEKVIPAIDIFKKFIVSEYIPNCREEVAWSSVPDGRRWYDFKSRKHTTTKLTADEIHEIGIKEVARIRSEMEKIKDKQKFKGDLKAFEKFLKEDPQFFFKSSRELLDQYLVISKKIDPGLVKLFGHLPRLPYGVIEMPEYKAKAAPLAYYQGGSLEAGRPGYFEANTFDLKASAKWQLEALTLHEAVPGHHLQIALAQELKNLPEFRKQTGPTAFIEGWALYAESLGPELGLYQDDFSKYGQLTFEMWRAIRLVVDTGLHAKGWSREKVMDFFRSNGPFSETLIKNETDRYIADPGQALAYKIGELKIKELKERSQKTLKDKFNIREFHDQILSSGAIPLDVLEKKMNHWLNEKVKTSQL